MNPSHSPNSITPTQRGHGWALLGVVAFALTLPMTRLATGSAQAPELSPWFVTWARCAIAGVLSLLYLSWGAVRWPSRAQVPWLVLALLGNALGFPLLIAWALRTVSASHAAVVTALLPLATAAAAACLLRQRASKRFWWFAVLGSVLTVGFVVSTAYARGGTWALSWADGGLLGAVVAGALGYVGGARLTPDLGAERVISWVCALTLPLALPLVWWTWPEHPVRALSWWALAYVGVFSMWAGFFAWFRGLAQAGAIQASQWQLLQPFLTILASMPLLGESVDALTGVFLVAVVATVYLGRLSASRPARR